MIASPERFGFYLDPFDPILLPRMHLLRDLGVRYLGFDGFRHRDLDSLNAVRRKVESVGLEVLVLHGEPALVATEGNDAALREQHLQVVARAAHFGARLIVLHFRLATEPDLDLAAHDRQMTALLREVAERAGEHGITLALENLPPQYPYAMAVSDIAAYLDTLNLPNVRLCLDSGHAHLCGLDIAECVRQAGPWLVTTHCHDNLGLCGVGEVVSAVDRHLAPGLGTINWPAVIRALQETQFPGPIMFEGVRTIPHGPQPDFERSAPLTLANWALFEKVARSL